MQIVDTGSHIEVHGGTDAMRKALCKRFTLPNPKYIGAVRAGKTPIGIPKTLEFYEQRGDGLRFPAAALPTIRECFPRTGFAVDWRPPLALPSTNLRFHGQLRLYQLAAVYDAVGGRHAVVEAPTGSGKTVIGLAAIAERRQPALVVVHSKLLLEQWRAACHRFLAVTPAIIGGGLNIWEPGADLTIALINSLAKVVTEVAPHVGNLVVDECHRCPSPMYRETLAQIAAPYRLGLSATPWRRDGLTDVIRWQLGEIVKVDRAALVTSGAILPAQIEQRYTEFTTYLNAAEHYSAVIDELARDLDRNMVIVGDALDIAQGGLTLCLTDRQSHCETLAEEINRVSLYPIAYARHGGQRVRAVRAFDDAMAAGRVHIMCATTQLVGEGFDLPELSAVLLCSPIKWKGKLLQAIGRALRPSDGQTHGRVLDYVDHHVPVLLASARTRQRAYRKLAQEEGS